MSTAVVRLFACWPLLAIAAAPGLAQYTVVDTGQTTCYDAAGVEGACPAAGEPLAGQDAQHVGHAPSYRVAADGLTVLDQHTGLTWQRSPDTDGDGDIDAADKLSWVELQEYPATLNGAAFGGYDDWRIATIKELYSLIDFRGDDPSGCPSADDCPDIQPFIDTTFFEFAYGDTAAGERLIDAQYWSGTEYVSTVFNGDAAVFGVNFADGRIKGYPRDEGPGGTQRQFVRLVRGNPAYGVNDFVANGDGTVTDLATGLVWQQEDDGVARDWAEALSHAEQLTLAGCTDWRLPDAKELQSIVDYARSPDTTGSAAIDPLFGAPLVPVENGQTNYPFYWTSTTHANWTATPGRWGAYVAFGEALGWMWEPFPPPGRWVLQDVHGAGAQRSDPKSGDPSEYPHGHGPQGDVVRIDNHVRAVRGEPVAACEIRVGGSGPTTLRFYPTCPPQSFDVVTGLVADLRADGGFVRATCLGAFEGEAADTRADPASGAAYYYLARGLEACDARGYGAAAGVVPDPRDELELLSPCD
jgi:hypothetical protein